MIGAKLWVTGMKDSFRKRLYTLVNVCIRLFTFLLLISKWLESEIFLTDIL